MDFEFILLSLPFGVVPPTWPSREVWHMHAPTFNMWHRKNKKNKHKKVRLHMLTHGAIQGCGLTSLVVCINDKIHDIREKIVTIRSEIWTMNILSLDFRDIREWAILWSLILWTLGCSTMNSEWWVTLSPITGVSCILTKVYPTATHIGGIGGT